MSSSMQAGLLVDASAQVDLAVEGNGLQSLTRHCLDPRHEAVGSGTGLAPLEVNVQLVGISSNGATQIRITNPPSNGGAGEPASQELSELEVPTLPPWDVMHADEELEVPSLPPWDVMHANREDSQDES